MFQSEHLKTGTVWQAEKTVALPKRAVYIQEQEGLDHFKSDSLIIHAVGLAIFLLWHSR